MGAWTEDDYQQALEDIDHGQLPHINFVRCIMISQAQKDLDDMRKDYRGIRIISDGLMGGTEKVEDHEMRILTLGGEVYSWNSLDKRISNMLT